MKNKKDFVKRNLEKAEAKNRRIADFAYLLSGR